MTERPGIGREQISTDPTGGSTSRPGRRVGGPPPRLALGDFFQRKQCPRGAEALLDGGLLPGGALIGAIGRTTAAALESRGLVIGVVASSTSFASLLSDTGEALARRRRSE